MTIAGFLPSMRFREQHNRQVQASIVLDDAVESGCALRASLQSPRLIGVHRVSTYVISLVRFSGQAVIRSIAGSKGEPREVLYDSD